MDYTLENRYLKVTVTTDGAQLKSVIRKCDGVEHRWNADPTGWGYHAPILFPHTGRLAGGEFEAKGKTYAAGAHGFARLMEHRLVKHSPQQLVLELVSSEETLQRWPYEFRLVSTFTLEEDTLSHTLTVENRDEGKLPFGIGYHPAFAVPFDKEHKATDYELRFNKLESPICLKTPGGLICGETYYLGRNITAIDVDEHLFDNDSHCMIGLQSTTFGLYEKDTGRGVVCDITDFPYTLIWSQPGMPRFICIEPWNSLPSPTEGSKKWEDKPAAAVLNPGESYSTTMRTSFVR